MFSLTFRWLLRAHMLLLLAVVLPAWSAIDPDLTADDSQGRVYLADGSVLVGEVTAIRGGEVTIKTTFTDADIQVPVALVQAFDRSVPTDLMLVDQNTLALETVTVREGQVQLDDKAIPLADIDIMNPEAWEEGKGFNWTGDTSAALAVARGNTDTNELDVSINTVVETVRDRYTFNGNIDRDDTGNTDGSRTDTADKWKLLGKYDYFLRNERNYVGFNLGLESDALAEIDLRTYAGPYFGRKLLNNDLIGLDGELGVVYVSTKYTEPQDGDAACVETFVANPDICRFDKQDYGAVNWNLTGESSILGGDSRLYLRHVGIVGVEGGDEVLIKTTAGLAFPLLFGFQAAAEFSFDYDGSLEQEIDQKYSFRVGYAW